jgi:hypothetical protein
MNEIPSYLLQVYPSLRRFFNLPDWAKRIGFGEDICAAVNDLHGLHQNAPESHTWDHLNQVYDVLKRLFGSPNWENRIGNSGDINKAIKELHTFYTMQRKAA